MDKHLYLKRLCGLIIKAAVLRAVWGLQDTSGSPQSQFFFNNTTKIRICLFIFILLWVEHEIFQRVYDFGYNNRLDAEADMNPAAFY